MAGFLWRRMFFPSQVPPNMPVGHTISLDYRKNAAGEAQNYTPYFPLHRSRGGAAPSRGGYPVTVRARPAG